MYVSQLRTSHRTSGAINSLVTIKKLLCTVNTGWDRDDALQGGWYVFRRPLIYLRHGTQPSLFKVMSCVQIHAPYYISLTWNKRTLNKSVDTAAADCDISGVQRGDQAGESVDPAVFPLPTNLLANLKVFSEGKATLPFRDIFPSSNPDQS